MSLDVYLEYDEDLIIDGSTMFAIPIRENGRIIYISIDEWEKRYPGITPNMVKFMNNTVFEANITHNLYRMASEAGIGKCLWNPDSVSIVFAEELIDPLEHGLDLLKGDPDRFKAFNPPNGWGDYYALVDFVSEYLAACKMFPDAKVRVIR